MTADRADSMTRAVAPAGAAADSFGEAEVSAALALLAATVGERSGRFGERYVEHAEGTQAILQSIGADFATRIAACLTPAIDALPLSTIEQRYGADVAKLVAGMRDLLALRELSRGAVASGNEQLETLRKMMLAMGSDVRVVLLRLASRLQSMRFLARTRGQAPAEFARETLEVLAPLAHRLGIGQLKWELEDLAFRFLEPERYKALAQQLDDKRTAREHFVSEKVAAIKSLLEQHRVDAQVYGRPKHLYSIHSKMQAKGRSFDQIRDLRAVRIIVATERLCFEVLGLLHQRFDPIAEEFDDYISRPKANGYQSLHTVVRDERGEAFEAQIRTPQMHAFAEFGVAAHWKYKESGGASGRDSRAPARTAAAGSALALPDATLDWARQLVAWQTEVGARVAGSASAAAARIYVLTPQGRIIELPAGATPVDFAYHVHTTIGHRCRGARVNGQQVALSSELHNGQTVEIVLAKAADAGPSRDWLNAELGFVRSARAKTKVRAWFNARELEHDIGAGRALLERALHREGRAGVPFDEIAARLSLPSAEALFVTLAKGEIGPQALAQAIRYRQSDETPAQPPVPAPDVPQLADVGAADRSIGARGAILVGGTDFMLTQLARCCSPLPPDPIAGFITRGRGVSLHRVSCPALIELQRRQPERILPASWRATANQRDKPRGYPAQIHIRAQDRAGLLRDITEVLARDQINVTAVNLRTHDQVAQARLSIQVADLAQLKRALQAIAQLRGVLEARRV